MPGQFGPTPRNPRPRRGGSRVPRTGREESRPLSGPRQIAVRIMYKTPQRTSSAPSPIQEHFRLSIHRCPAQQNWNQSREGRIRSGRNNRREQNREALGADAHVTTCQHSSLASRERRRVSSGMGALSKRHRAPGTIPLPVGAPAPPVHMIKLTETGEITPYLWSASERGMVNLNPAGELQHAELPE